MVELFCVGCSNRYLCESPCAAWYDCLENQLRAEDEESENS